MTVTRKPFGSRLETRGAYIELSRRWRTLTTEEKCRYLELLWQRAKEAHDHVEDPLRRDEAHSRQ